MTALVPPDQPTTTAYRPAAVSDERIIFSLSAYPERQPLSWRVTTGLVQVVALPVVMVGAVVSILLPDRYWTGVLTVMVIAIALGTFTLAQVWNAGVPSDDRDLSRGGVDVTKDLDRLSERASLGSPQATDPASFPMAARADIDLAGTTHPSQRTTFPS